VQNLTELHVYNLYTNGTTVGMRAIEDLITEFIACHVKVAYRSIFAHKLFEGKSSPLAL
jgi:hypothetical protein